LLEALVKKGWGWLFQDLKLPPQHIGDRLLIPHTRPIVVRADRDEMVEN